MSHSDNQPVANPANTPSARFFESVDISAGMRVLDVGCGDGDLSRFVAALVGPNGEVVAIDRSEPALAKAQSHEANAGKAPIDYRAADLSGALSGLGKFDAIIGRRVLMYLPDAAETLARLHELAKPGAVLAFQEHARADLPSGLGDLPIHRQIYDWVWSTVAAEGGDVKLGLCLAELMRDRGLIIQQACSEAILLQPYEPSFIPTLARLMLPRMIQQGVVDADEIEPDHLAERIEDERRTIGGTIAWDLAFLIAARNDTSA